MDKLLITHIELPNGLPKGFSMRPVTYFQKAGEVYKAFYQGVKGDDTPVDAVENGDKIVTLPNPVEISANQFFAVNYAGDLVVGYTDQKVFDDIIIGFVK